MKKLAVHLHLHYFEQLPEILKYLQALNGVEYDLFVTMTQEDKDIAAQILTEHPCAQIWVVENRGYDIGPFIEFLHRIDLNEYEYVLKLHTKGKKSGNYTHLNGFRMDNALWGRILWESLLASSARLKGNLNILDTRKDAEMLGSKYCVTSATQDYDKLLSKVNAALQKMGLKEVQRLSFVAGAMFIVRTAALKPLLTYQLTDFDLTDGRVKEGTLAHIMERIFGVLGAPIIAIDHGNYRWKLFMTSINRFFWQKKVTKTGRTVIKIMKLPICSIRIGDS